MPTRTIPAAPRRACAALALAALAHVAGGSMPARAADTAPPAPSPAASPEPAPATSGVDADLAAARRALAAQDWPGAAAVLRAAAARAPTNADVFNLLGYATRKGGDVAGGMAHYATALRLDPRHRGALEYQGEGFLQLRQPERAEANLALLRAACNGTACAEYQDLARALAAYRAGTAPDAGAVKPRYSR